MSVVMGVGYQLNKFEQVSNDDHQMSLARGKGILPQWREVGGSRVSHLTRGGRVSHDICDDVTYPTPL